MASEAKNQELPGRLVATTTKAGDFEYTVEYRVFDSAEEYAEAAKIRGEDPAEAIKGLINSAQKQGATQGPKGGVREALEAEYDSEEERDAAIDAAVEKAAAAGARYIVGAPTGTRSTGGITKKAQDAFGRAFTAAMAEKGGMLTQAETEALAKEMGIDPALL